MANTIATPVYFIYLQPRGGGELVDITDYIESFRFELSTERDNQLDLSIFSRLSEGFANNEVVTEGDTLIFKYGYLGTGQMSANRVAVVKEIKYNYAERVNITVRALDKGNQMRQKSGNGVVFKNKTAAQIVAEIAAKNGLSTVIQGGAALYKSIAQGGKNDIDFCKYLAAKEAAGNYTVYVEDNILYYVPRATDTPAKITFSYGDPNGELIKFDSSYNEAGGGKGDAAQTTTAGFDPLEKKPVTEKVNNETEAEETVLGKVKNTISVAFDSNADEIGRRVITTPEETETTNSKAAATGNGLKKAAGRRVLTGNFTTRLNPNLTPNIVVTIDGVYNRDKGNWLITEVKHEITPGGGGFTTGKVEKNGTIKRKRVNSTEAGKTNDTVGGKKLNGEVVVYNQDAEELRRETR